jgi:hypothetical protein
MIATGFPRYKSRHGRGTDFDHHGLGAATLATECVAVNQMSPLELVQMSLATIPDAMLYNLADHSSGIVPGNRTSHLALPPPDRPRQSEPVERTSGGNSLPGTYYTGEQRAKAPLPARGGNQMLRREELPGSSQRNSTEPPPFILAHQTQCTTCVRMEQS